MKTLAIILTATLFGAMAWVMMDARNKATSATNQLELFRKQQKGGAQNFEAATAPQPAMTPEDLELAVKESKLLSQQVTNGNVPPPLPPGATLQGQAPSRTGPGSTVIDPAMTAAPPPLTPRQRQVLAAPSIGKVTEFQKEYGFLVFTGGSSRQIEKDMTFGVRRGNSIIGRIKVTSVEDASAVADLETQSVPPGVIIKVGDDIIQDIPPGA